MKNVILFILAMNSLIIGAQVQNPEFRSLGDLEFYIRNNNPAHNTAEGSKYLNDEFLPAKINGIQKTQLVRFNVPDNVIEVKKSNDEIMALAFAKGYIIHLQDGSDKVYEMQSYVNREAKSETTFFEKLYAHQNFKLYLKENITFTAAKKARSGYEPAKPAKFSKGNDAFYVIGFGSDAKEPNPLPKKRKNFVQLFGKQAQTIEKKIKAEKLNLKKSEDLISIFEAYFEK